MPLRNVATNYTFEQQRQEINLLAADVDAIANQQGTETTDSPTFNSIFLGSTLYGPTLFTIDPATHGDDTGTIVIKGNLQIDGTTTTVNSTVMSVNDLNITLADGASNAAAADGAGLTVDGAGATLNYNGTTDEWEFNKSLRLTSANLFCTNVEPSNNIQLQDDKKLLCGASSDLQIFHDAVNTHSRIKNTAGQLWLQSDNGIRFTDADINQSMAAFYDNGAVELYHNGTKKFETTTSGLTIHEDTNKTISFTGSIGEIGNVTGFQALNTAGSSLVDFGMRANTLRFATGNAERLRITSTGQLNLAGNMQFTAADPELEFNNGGPRFKVPAANTLSIHTGGGLGATTAERLRINSVGTFHFMNGLLVENGIVDTTARNGIQAVNLDNGMVHYFQSSATGTWKPNFRVNSTNTLNDSMGVGDFCSPTMIVNKQNSAHYADSVQIDGSDVIVDWLGGPPTAGGGNNTWDVYSYTILKNGNASFKCWASVSTYNQ